MTDSKIQKIHVRAVFPLHEAAKKGEGEEVEKLVAYGKCEVNEIDKFGQTALHVSAFEGHLQCVEVLLKKGAALSVQDKNGWTPLFAAATNGHLLICERLLLEGADPRAQNSSKSTALHYLMALPCSDLILFVLHLMMKRGANINVKNEHGNTPLHTACLRSGEGMVLFLLNNHAQVDATNNYHETALHMASRSGKKRVVQLLINYGASLDAEGPDGTAEQEATKAGHTEIADFLRALRSQSTSSEAFELGRPDDSGLTTSRSDSSQVAESSPRKKTSKTKAKRGKLARQRSSKVVSPRTKDEPSELSETSTDEGAHGDKGAKRTVSSEKREPSPAAIAESENENEPTSHPENTTSTTAPAVKSQSESDLVEGSLTASSSSPAIIPAVTSSTLPAPKTDPIILRTSPSPSRKAMQTSTSRGSLTDEEDQPISLIQAARAPRSGSDYISPPPSGDSSEGEGAAERAAKRQRSIKIDSLMKIFEAQSGVDLRTSTLPSRPRGSTSEAGPSSSPRTNSPMRSPNSTRTSTARIGIVPASSPKSPPSSNTTTATQDPPSSPESSDQKPSEPVVAATTATAPVAEAQVVAKVPEKSPEKVRRTSSPPPRDSIVLSVSSPNVALVNSTLGAPILASSDTAALVPTKSAESLAPSGRIKKKTSTTHVKKDSSSSAASKGDDEGSEKRSRRRRRPSEEKEKARKTSSSTLKDSSASADKSDATVSPRDRSKTVADGSPSPREVGYSGEFDRALMRANSVIDTSDDGRTSPMKLNVARAREQMERRKSFGDLSGHASAIGRDRDSPPNTAHHMSPKKVDSVYIFGFKQQAINSSAPKPTQRLHVQEQTRPKPFDTPLSEVDFDKFLTVRPIPAMEIPKPHKTDIVVADNNFNVDCGRNTEAQDAAMQLFIEDQEFTTAHYKENFFGSDGKPLPHSNYVGHIQFPFYPSGEPVIISTIVKDTLILGVCRTRAGDVTFRLENPSGKAKTGKQILKHLLDQNEQLAKHSKLTPVKDPQLIDDLLNYERVEKNHFHKISQHKIAVICVKPFQETEGEIFENEHEDTGRFEQFLQCLGQKIELEGWTGYTGGLDTKGSSGKHSIFTKWLDFEIMFHVSTYIPLEDGDERLVERKRHIGNDVTCIVFLDVKDNTTFFVPPTISGDFLHVFIVVKPVGEDLYQINTASKVGVPNFGPPLPHPPQLRKGEAMRDFILSKLINAERAAQLGTNFASKKRQARQRFLASMVDSAAPKRG